MSRISKGTYDRYESIAKTKLDAAIDERKAAVKEHIEKHVEKELKRLKIHADITRHEEINREVDRLKEEQERLEEKFHDTAIREFNYQGWRNGYALSHIKSSIKDSFRDPILTALYNERATIGDRIFLSTAPEEIVEIINGLDAIISKAQIKKAA